MKNKRSFNIIIDISSIAFLLLPNLIFFIGWYKWYIGFPLTLLSVYLLYKFYRGYQSELKTEELEIPDTKYLFGMLGVSLLLAYIGGMGELTYQTTDYIKHNVIFSNLATKPWPVNAGDPRSPGDFLCYGLAYYLPASSIGKIFGLKSVIAGSFVWGASGIFLCLIWIQRTANLYKWTFILIFLFFNGLDPLFNLIDGQVKDLNEILSWDGIGYPILLSYISPARLVVWNPQYTIPAWLGTSMIVYLCRLHKNGVGISAFVASLTLIWAPFITMGLIPVWIYYLVKSRLKNLINFYSVSGGIILVIVAAYYAAHEPIKDYPEFLWQEGLAHALRDYSIFIMVEIGVYLILVYIINRKYKLIPSSFRQLMILSVAVLLVLPIYRMGLFNDFLMRVSMPSLLLMTLGIVSLLYKTITEGLYRKSFPVILMWIFFAIGATVPVRFLATPLWPAVRVAKNSIADDSYSIYDLNDLHGGWEISFQYRGSNKSFYYKYLSSNYPGTSNEILPKSSGFK